MKRQASTASSIGAKKGKSERAEAFNKLRDVSDKLDEMEKNCAEEQIEVQRKWDKKKQLFFDERREIIKQIPKFFVFISLKKPLVLGWSPELRAATFLKSLKPISKF